MQDLDRRVFELLRELVEEAGNKDIERFHFLKNWIETHPEIESARERGVEIVVQDIGFWRKRSSSRYNLIIEFPGQGEDDSPITVNDEGASPITIYSHTDTITRQSQVK
ncbi:hypothetical protein JXB41_01220 [Candidatus Woesearchaeota archaeon]|nr:hypothetical protein [Candidatus Woesearchaeota archaeon]